MAAERSLSVLHGERDGEYMASVEKMDLADLEVEADMGFFKAREMFGWSEPDLRAEAWRACLQGEPKAFEAAAGKLKSLDFRHGPSGLSLLGLILRIENGSDDLDAPLIQLAIRLGAKPDFPIDSKGALALYRCAMEGRIDAALLLIGKGADMNAREPGGHSVAEMARGGHRVCRRIVEISKP